MTDGSAPIFRCKKMRPGSLTKFPKIPQAGRTWSSFWSAVVPDFLILEQKITFYIIKYAGFWVTCKQLPTPTPWDFEYLILISVPEICLFNTSKCCFSNGYSAGHILRNTVIWSSSYFTSLPSYALFSTAETGRRFQGDKKGKFRMPSPAPHLKLGV